MSEPLVRLKEFVSLRLERPLFRPISLALTPGDALEITGANGAGKTTLLRSLAGLHGQSSGTASVTDFLYHGHRPGLDDSLTAVKNLEWYRTLAGQPVDLGSIRAALTEVGALKFALSPVGALSQGQQRRVAMARWRLDPHPVWLLDEPATALDAAGCALLCALIEAHRGEGGVVLFSTHQPLDLKDKRVLELEAPDA